jgi:hypothetical protein
MASGTLIGPLTLRPLLSITSSVRGQLLADSAKASDFAAEIVSASLNSLVMSWFLGYRIIAVNILVEPPRYKTALGVKPSVMRGKSRLLFCYRLGCPHSVQFSLPCHPTARALRASRVAYMYACGFHTFILFGALRIVKGYFQDFLAAPLLAPIQLFSP